MKLVWLTDLPILNTNSNEVFPIMSDEQVKITLANWKRLDNETHNAPRNNFIPTEAERRATFNHDASPDEVFTCAGQCAGCKDTSCENNKDHEEVIDWEKLENVVYNKHLNYTQEEKDHAKSLIKQYLAKIASI